MATTLNKEAYQRLITEDIAKLWEKFPRTSLEAQHIERVLNWSVKALYPCSHERLNEDGVCRECNEDRRGI